MGQSASCKTDVNQKSTSEFEAQGCKASNLEISFLASWKLKQKAVTFFYERLLSIVELILLSFTSMQGRTERPLYSLSSWYTVFNSS